MKNLFALTLFLISLITTPLTAHKCIHDTLKFKTPLRDSPPLKPPKLSIDAFKAVTQSEYKNIRIYADFTSLTSGSTVLREYIQNQLMPSAISYFQAALQVVPVKGRLTVNSACADLYPGRSLMTPGVEADLAILVYADYFQESFVAAAVPCALDSSTYRPVYGAIFFNLNYLFTESASALEENLSTTLHEITHILGFANYLFEYYINPTTGRFLENHVGQKVVNGQTISYLNVEPLTSRLRAYFNCPTIEGAYLENAGEEGSAGSHFERRIFMNDYMTASTITDAVVSEFGLALLEGTGWYKVDYTRKEPFTWGKNEGCSFLDGPCVDSKAQPNFDEFCSPLTHISCSFSARAIAICGTLTGYMQTDPKLPASIDYWGNQTSLLDPFGDNCPYYIGFSSTDCENTENQKYASFTQEKYGPTSRCFGGTLSRTSSTARHFGYCFPTECKLQANGNYVVQIIAGSETILCTKESKMSISSLLGYIECPEPNAFCEKANPSYCERGCSGRTTCVNNQCVCPEGWGGRDCGLRVFVDNCARCVGNSAGSSCFGDGCSCNPDTTTCSGPRLIGSGGEYDGTGDGGGTTTPGTGESYDTRKVGVLVWLIVCVIVLFWKSRMGREIRPR